MPIETFGKYQMVKKLATGGMAEVWLARQTGIDGFNRHVVVKRILPHLAEDPEFVQMFLNEAKIAARFNHPNIAQIYELGQIEGSYFIAMEFIHGEDLGRLMRKAWSTGQWIARPLAIRIVASACEGLHYAHTRMDESGRPLRVVHRDISPQNILISFDGSVKVVDFGIAKAADQASMTKSGAIKGKFAYMAPEQAAGKPLDARTDTFALGLVLYELLTGVRPLKRDSELATLQAALECAIDPPSVVAEVPSELDEVVMKALAKAPDDRYKDSRSFQMALEEFLISQRLVATSVQISELMETLFADRRAEEARLGAPNPAPLESVLSNPMVLEIFDLGANLRMRVPEQGLVLGREGGKNHHALGDPTVSKRHARVYMEGGKWILEDLGSSNGTWLNGQRISGRTPLLKGDTFRLGKGRFEVVGSARFGGADEQQMSSSALETRPGNSNGLVPSEASGTLRPAASFQKRSGARAHEEESSPRGEVSSYVERVFPQVHDLTRGGAVEPIIVAARLSGLAAMKASGGEEARLQRLDAARQMVNGVQRILRSRLPAPGSAQHRRWATWIANAEAGGSTLTRSETQIRKMLAGDEQPSLIAIAHWIDEKGQPRAAQLATEIQSCLAVPERARGLVFALGKLRNVLAHPEDYEGMSIQVSKLEPEVRRYVGHVTLADSRGLGLGVDDSGLHALSMDCLHVVGEQD